MPQRIYEEIGILAAIETESISARQAGRCFALILCHDPMMPRLSNEKADSTGNPRSRKAQDLGHSGPSENATQFFYSLLLAFLRLRRIMRFARDRASLRMTRRGRVEKAGRALVGLWTLGLDPLASTFGLDG